MEITLPLLESFPLSKLEKYQMAYKGYHFFCSEYDSLKCNGVHAWAKL